MRSIGVRELRQRASEYLKQVEDGETLQVTSHGRPVALLVPAVTGRLRDRLLAQGRLDAGSGDLLDLGRPLRPARQVQLPSERLRDARDDER